jgi:primase-polymerase (primpol)-like protein
MTETQETTTESHTTVLVEIENIPEELRRRPQWLVWKYEERDGRPTKIPYIAGGVGRASSTDSLTWRTFDEAAQALKASPGRYDGIGFVFSSGDPFAGVDLDKCRDPETGELEEWAAEIVASLGGYAEASPSGTGVHIIVRGKARNKKRGRVEAYSSERYFTMTGRVL